MAKQFKPTAANGAKEATPAPAEFSKEWIEQNREKILTAVQDDMGIQLVDKATFDKMTQQKTAVEKAADELGIDFDKASKVGNAPLRDVTDLVNRTADYIDVMYQSTQWRDIMSRKQKCALHAVRVFIRQLRNERPPTGQAGTLAELLSAPGVPTNPVNAIAMNKRIKVTDAHFEAISMTNAGPKPDDLEV